MRRRENGSHSLAMEATHALAERHWDVCFLQLRKMVWRGRCRLHQRSFNPKYTATGTALSRSGASPRFACKCHAWFNVEWGAQGNQIKGDREWTGIQCDNAYIVEHRKPQVHS
jgi:hypothetical protein